MFRLNVMGPPSKSISTRRYSIYYMLARARLSIAAALLENIEKHIGHGGGINLMQAQTGKP